MRAPAVMIECFSFSGSVCARACVRDYLGYRIGSMVTVVQYGLP